MIKLIVIKIKWIRIILDQVPGEGEE